MKTSKEIKYVTQSKEEFLKQHKDVLVSFSSYYKYKFYFRGFITGADGIAGVLTMGYGGDSSDIYRFEVCKDDTFTVDSLDWDSGTYLDYTTNTQYSFYDH